MQYPFQCSSLYDLENSESPVTYDPLASTSFLKDSICAHTDISYENGSYQKSLQPRSGKMLGPGPEISF